MERMLNLARGCARLEVTGASTPAFLNRLAASGVEFWDAEPADGLTLRVTVRASDAAAAVKLAERASCSAKILRRRGAPVLGRRLRRRYALIVCLAAFALALLTSSLFIWDVEVVGNENVSTGEILRALDESGVRIGAFWPSLSGDLIRNETILRLPELRWVGVSVDGSRAVVKVRERVQRPEEYKSTEPYSVIASATGIITKMSVLQGEPLVAVGDAVTEGETLVSGRLTSTYEGAEDRYVHASAVIEASTWYELTAAMPVAERVRTREAADRTRWALVLGNMRINFYSDSSKMTVDCGKIIREYSLSWDGVFSLPVTLVRETVTRYETETAALDAAQMRGMLTDELTRTLTDMLDGGEIVSASFTENTHDGVFYVTMLAECSRNIAVETPITP